jgi:S-adenosyl-L-methionine hydrolase (adenosine-forming)
MSGLITFLSDYGHAGGYVAACEAVIATLAPAARVLHVTHEIAVGDVGEGAQVLARVAPLGPVAVHLAVVDPGVGTSRRPLIVHVDRGDYLVGPDNGLLLPAAEALGGIVSTWSLDLQRLRTQAGLPAHFPATFHGRDLFAPATALLHRGLLPPLLAEPLDAATLATLPATPVLYESGVVVAWVVEVDRFGNVALGVSLDEVALPGTHVDVEVDSDPDSRWPARVVRTYAELRLGELGLYQDSWGNAALTLNGASAGELLAADRGAKVRLIPGGVAARDSASDRVGETA